MIIMCLIYQETYSETNMAIWYSVVANYLWRP